MAIGRRELRNRPEQLLSIAPLVDATGVEVIDHIERRQFSIRTPAAVEPSAVPTDGFEFPVSRAVTIQTGAFTIPHQFGVLVRNSLGFMVAEVSKGQRDSFPPDTYSLDPGTPIKAYLRFESGFSVDIADDGIHVELDTPGAVHIGVRSHHKRPAATITTTGAVADLMEAVSYFGSALKTTSCERSYPTLRGHPPTIELGERQSIPPVLAQPETGVTIEVPETYRAVFTTATLAYYLGASVEPGPEPRIVTDDGFEHRLGGSDRSLECEAERVLKQVFLLDCLTRTEGFFQVDLHERNQLEGTLGLDFPELYECSLADQLPIYLDVDYEQIRPYVPRWKLTAYATTELEYVDTLPFLVNDLAVVRPGDTGIRRTDSAGEVGRTDGEILADGLARSADTSTSVPDLVHVSDGDAVEQAWVGPGAPVGASKAMLAAFENRLNRSPAGDAIEITVVCNATEMRHEGDVVNEIYGSRDDLPFDLTVHHELGTEQLEQLLSRDIDFLHYIGHIDEEGFECTDGHLDAGALEETNVDVFFLNACSSYEQGMELIRAGSIAGVVTLEDVINSGAERIGLTLARFLNAGFPLWTALNLSKDESIMGSHYLAIGHGGIEIAQPENGIPALCRISDSPDKFTMDYVTFPGVEKGQGSIVKPHISQVDEYHIISGAKNTHRLNRTELKRYLQMEDMPMNYQGELYWDPKFFE